MRLRHFALFPHDLRSFAARRRPSLLGKVIALLSILVCGGCARHDYRLAADREAYALIANKVCPQWLIPARPVEPEPDSRLADMADPDCPPIPPDDPAAACLMEHPYRYRGAKVYQKRDRVPFIEYPTWQAYLPRNEDGVVKLSRDNVMPIAIKHSRSYQTEYEQLYLAALNLSLERFAFDVQLSAGTGTIFNAIGNTAPPGTRDLAVNNNLGLTRRLAGGGQFLVDFANTFLWEFSGSQVSRASSSMLVQLTQPLMRGAFREVQLESLTQAERNLLYQTRFFARFRRGFYVDTMGDSGYLGLLSLAQAIRNQQKNLDSLERNLEEHQALAAAGLVRAIQVDQVYQDYEQGRLRLLSVNQTLAAALDRYKIQLGLPPTLNVAIDEEALEPFQLSDPRFDRLEDENETIRLSLLQFDLSNVPDKPYLENAYRAVIDVLSEIPELHELIVTELNAWQDTLQDSQSFEEDPEELERRNQLANDLRDFLANTEEKLHDDLAKLRRQQQQLPQSTAEDAWSELKTMVGENVRERLADLFVIQTQIRAYRITVQPVELSDEDVMQIALANRLDLMNARGRVVDDLRRVEVAADGLESDLDLVVETELRTSPERTNGFRFDSSAHRYRAGVRFDGPLNRLAERNVYRASQIAYQRSRRDFMAVRDEVAAQVRQDLRQIKFNQFSFEVTRRQLITAVRQVEEAQFGLRNSTVPNSSLTRDLLSALQQLLSAQNSLISSWTAYETSRMNLYRDLGFMEVNGEGLWINEHDSVTAPLPEELEIGFPASDTFGIIPPEPINIGAEFDSETNVEIGIDDQDVANEEFPVAPKPPAPATAIDE